MGPRLEGRGEIQPLSKGMSTNTLQWGRGWKAAESRPFMLRWCDATIASMGPRLEGRGELQRTHD